MIPDPTTAIPGQASDAQTIAPATDKEALARYRRYLRAFETNKRDELEENQEHDRYYNAKQWSDSELKTLKKRRQPPITDNAIGRKIDFLVGVEQRMRRDPKAYPRTPKHEHDADTATAAIRFVCDKNRWEQRSSNGMHDGLVKAKGVIWVGIRPSRQGNEVALEDVDPGRFFYDPRSIKADFSDARYMGVHIWQDIDEAKEQNPGFEKQLDSLIENTKGSYSIVPAEADQAEQWGDLENRRVRIVEIYEKRLQAPMMTAQWHYCRFTGDVELQSMVSPYLDADGEPECPYIAWSPYIDEKGNRYGPIRNMKSMQDEINHRRSRALHELNSRQTFSNRGGAVEDIDQLKAEINKPDGHLAFQGGEWGKDVGIIDRSAQLQGQFELLQQSIQRMENFGPNPGLIGQGGGIADQSGRAILAQRDSGMTELSPVFERQRDWKLRVYRSIWGRIRQAWTAERWINVTDDDSAAQFIQVNQYEMVADPVTGEQRIVANNVVSSIDVDIILDEGPDTIVMQEELLQTISKIGEAAVGPLGKVIIELSNVPQKERLLNLLDEAAAPPPEVQQLQARLAALEQAQQAAQADKTTAESGNKRADTLSKLIQALTPQQQQTDEFGNPKGPAPQPPNIAMALQLMEMLEPQVDAEPPAPTPPQQPEQGGPMGPEPMPMNMPPPGANAMLPPQGQMMEPAFG